MELVIIVVVGLALMWLFVVLPQRRRAAAHDRLVSALGVGDEVMTAGGLYGTVTGVGEEEVRVELAPGVEVRVARRAVAAVLEDDQRAADERSVDGIRG